MGWKSFHLICEAGVITRIVRPSKCLWFCFSIKGVPLRVPFSTHFWYAPSGPMKHEQANKIVRLGCG